VTFPKQIAVASRNPGKIREILTICRDWPVTWLTAVDPHRSRGPESDRWPDVPETGETYLENARLKARAVAAAVRSTAIADDSGIEVDALGGGPGVRSARFAGEEATDQANLRQLIEGIREVPESDRTARYRCIAVCAWPDGRDVWAEATCEGRLILEARGTGGFGYDPIFVPDELDRVGDERTMAEISEGEKNAISHRGKAFRALRMKLSAT
jgi:XTP/dITP diphosphohydrolase